MESGKDLCELAGCDGRAASTSTPGVATIVRVPAPPPAPGADPAGAAAHRPQRAASALASAASDAGSEGGKWSGHQLRKSKLYENCKLEV